MSSSGDVLSALKEMEGRLKLHIDERVREETEVLRREMDAHFDAVHPEARPPRD